MSKYTPGAKYSWNATDKFEITGKDLEVLQSGLNVVEEMVKNNSTTMSLERFLLLVESYKTIHARFISYVEQDQIKVPEE